jgi:hypothetical protein
VSTAIDGIVAALAQAMSSGDTDRWFDPESGCVSAALPDGAAAGRLVRIPDRSQIEHIDHVRAFLDDYAPDEPYLQDQAHAAFTRVRTPIDWRRALGPRHRAVCAFDAWMSGFYLTMARLFLINQRPAHLGILGYGHTGSR